MKCNTHGFLQIHTGVCVGVWVDGWVLFKCHCVLLIMDIVAHCSSSLMANTAFSEGYERKKDNVKMAYDLSPYLLIVKCSYHPCQVASVISALPDQISLVIQTVIREPYYFLLFLKANIVMCF